MVQLLDCAHAMVLEGVDPGERHKADDMFEQGGHDLRIKLDPVYMRATWGRRPEDGLAQRDLIGDLTGERTR